MPAWVCPICFCFFTALRTLPRKVDPAASEVAMAISLGLRRGIESASVASGSVKQPCDCCTYMQAAMSCGLFWPGAPRPQAMSGDTPYACQHAPGLWHTLLACCGSWSRQEPRTARRISIDTCSSCRPLCATSQFSAGTFQKRQRLELAAVDVVVAHASEKLYAAEAA